MVPSNQKSQDSKWSKKSKDETIDSLPENVKSIARNLRIAVEQMHLGITKAKELILEDNHTSILLDALTNASDGIESN